MEKINDLKSRIDMDSIDSLLADVDSFDVSYNAKRDTFLLQLIDPPPAISVDYNGLLWLRVNPQNGKVVGIEIEGFRKTFLKRCHELINELEDVPLTTTHPFKERISRELIGCLS